MSLLKTVRVVRGVLDGPLVRPVRVRWQRELFLSSEGAGAYYGVFGSFADARAWLPRSKEFDHAPLAAHYIEVRCRMVFPYDYPVMLWLERAFQGGAARVLDFGGSVGVHYYAYRRYIAMPATLAWRVVELPTMVSIGRSLAAANAATALSFTEDLPQAVVAADSDIWLSAGAIHYMEDARPALLLERCAVRPKHILLNKLPLYGGEDFVTSQNIGDGSFAPLHVFNRRRFIRDIEEVGYTLWDSWAVPERALYLSGDSEHRLPSFTGLYFVDSQLIPDKSRVPPYKAVDFRFL
ncbi:methyltransferase, TIGR04325 family [Variovorax sp. M-6]|uniref:methyltransferase, TIGR04325 family n=1 Tax=Variovorax sp. M-6 TaxID=3233041 RepID=UPI003F9B6D43